jgi:hypothetical protein
MTQKHIINMAEITDHAQLSTRRVSSRRVEVYMRRPHAQASREDNESIYLVQGLTNISSFLNTDYV